MEKLYSMPTDGESWTYLGQRDGSLYFMHSVTTDNGGTTPSSIDKLENGTMTTVYTPQSDQWPEFESYSQDG